MAACVAVGALVLYVLTLAPTTQFWDTSEYIAAAHVLGIPHPPGNPLFTIIAHVWGLLPLAAGYAMRINLLAATTSAVAAGCWFLIGERWMRAWVPATWPRRLAALAGAMAAATAFTVWNQSVVNEKVYTLSLVSVALVLWLILRWDDQPAGEAHDHYLLLIVYLLALTATNHMMGVLVGPAVVVLLHPLLKETRPADDAGRRVEWSQWYLFCGLYAIIVASGLESVEPLYAAAVLFALALAYAVLRARNWDFAVAALVVAVVGGQGYVFGRGNQQLSPEVISRVGLDNIEILAALDKVLALDPPALRVDTGDPALDAKLTGYRRVRIAPNRSLVLKVST